MITLDSDGQHNPEQIPTLVSALTKNNVDVVIGSRFLDKNTNSPGYRKTGIKIISSASNFGTNFKVSDLIEWIKEARPTVEGKQRSFLTCPFWVPIYRDTHSYQMIIGGRQIYKSTACTDFIAAEATSHDGIQVCYVTHDERSLSMFSKQKLRY